MNRVHAALCAGACLFALHAAAEPPPVPAQPFDWCSRVVVRPDSRFRREGGDRCTPIWSDTEIAAGAELALIGDASDVSDGRFAHQGPGCSGRTTSHLDNARYMQKLRSLRTGGAPLRVVHMHRFDLVTDSLAALPGFQADFLLSTDRPWSAVTKFFESDRSPACAGGCRWSDAYGGWEDRGKGTWLSERIDAAGGKDRSRSVVYYMVRAQQVKQLYWPTAAVADLSNPAYRAWRVAEAKRALVQGGYDAISLNQKFSQFQQPHWLGSATVPDAASLRAQGSDTFWTAQPRGYGLREYVQGWIALGADLRAAGVPYAIIDMSAWPWLLDPDNASIGDPALVRGIGDTVLGARIVLVERTARTDTAGRDAFVAELERRGAQVVWVDSRCGFLRK